MNCTQTNICLPNAGLVIRGPNALYRRSSISLFKPSHVRVTSLQASATPKLRQHKRCTRVCANGGKGNSDSGNEWVERKLPFSWRMIGACFISGVPDQAFSWDSLKKAMGGLGKQPSIEEMLRKQIENNEFVGEGGGGNPPSSGGDGSGGSEDGDFSSALDEFLQVVMATIGFIFVYVMLIRGEELTRLARDYVKYLFGGKMSMRLERCMADWRKFYDSILWIPPREDWLERAIVATPTWWYNPRQLLRMIQESSRKSHDDDS